MWSSFHSASRQSPDIQAVANVALQLTWGRAFDNSIVSMLNINQVNNLSLPVRSRPAKLQWNLPASAFITSRIG
jgi:hypothetical protein